MLSRFFCLLFSVITCTSLNAADQPLIIPSSLKSVTIYRSGAEMTHLSSATLMSGAQELLIEGISNRVDINSIQINCPSAVTIMGIEFSNNFMVSPEVSSRIRLLQDSADRLQKDLDRLSAQMQTTADLIEVLKSNRQIKGEQSGLSVAELMKLMDYYRNKSTELQLEFTLQKEKQKKLSEQLTKIRNQIREEESKNTRNAGQLRLQLSVAAYGKYDFNISYLTPNAWWSPYYDIRVDRVNSPMKLVYKAKIAQTTGIDWKKVKLSLSTSMPSQWGNAPVLNAWFLSYINPVAVMDKRLSNTVQSYGLTGKVAGINVESAPVKLRGNAQVNSSQPVYIVNGAFMSAEEFSKISASSIKTQQVLDGEQASSLYGSRAYNGAVIVTLKDGLEDYVSVSDNELNITYDIELPYDLPTNGKEQTASLKEQSLEAMFKYYAVPKLDKDAYLLAEVADWEKLNLLPGEAGIIFEGTYVGKSFIDPASTSDTLNLTLGRDKRVIIKKEKLVDFSSTKFLGTNKLQKIYHELTVRNNKKDTIRMLLKDQYPLSTLKEIEVELLESSGAMVNPETGVLTWKVELAPGETKKYRMGYSVKYPRDKTIYLN